MYPDNPCKGDLLIWDIKNPGELHGNHVTIIFVNDCTDDVIGGTDPDFWLGRDFDINCAEDDVDFSYNVQQYRAKNYHRGKHKLPPLTYGEYYGYVPIPALGSRKSYKTL